MVTVITGQRSFIPGLSAQFKGLFMHLSVVLTGKQPIWLRIIAQGSPYS